MLACDLDRFATASMEELYGLGDAEVEAQRQMMEEFSKSMKKTDNEPILQQPEEESKEPDSTSLRSSRSLCYTVAWFDGKVERF